MGEFIIVDTNMSIQGSTVNVPTAVWYDCIKDKKSIYRPLQLNYISTSEYHIIHNLYLLTFLKPEITYTTYYCTRFLSYYCTRFLSYYSNMILSYFILCLIICRTLYYDSVVLYTMIMSY